MKKSNNKRADSSRRGRAIRRDATVGSAEKIIANELRLPVGSVRLVLPNLKKARSDKTIASLLRDWDYED